MSIGKLQICILSIVFSVFVAEWYFGFDDFAYAQTSSYIITNPDLEGKPTSATVNEKTNTVYITDFFGGKLVVMDGESNEILETIEVVRTPFGVGVNPESGLIYVGGEFANTVSILDTASYQEIKQIYLEDPYDIAVDTNSNRIYITSDRQNSVFVLDGNTNEIISSFEVLIPCGITVNPVSGMVYVTSESENQVHVWDGKSNKEVAIIKVQESPRGVTVNSKTNMIYVTNQESNTISVIDGSTNKLVDHINVGEIPRRVVVDSQSNLVYVSNQESKEISVIDGRSNKVTETIPVIEPFELAINSENGKLYSMYYGGGLSIISKSIYPDSPMKQFTQGVEPLDTICREGFTLVLKNSNQHPACVMPSTAQKLIERGWASDIE